MAVSAAEEGKQSKQAEQEGDHQAEIFSGSAPPDQSLGAGRSFGEGQRMESGMIPPVKPARRFPPRAGGRTDNVTVSVPGRLHFRVAGRADQEPTGPPGGRGQ